MSAIFKREMRSYFTSPIGYIVLFVYTFVSGVYFYAIYSNGSSQVNQIFSITYMVSLFVIPILTMRLFSEERRQKTDQILLTSPVSLWGIVMGKFMAAFCMFAISNSLLIIYELIVSAYVTPDILVFLCSALGALIFAASIISIGLFISSLTESQMTAAICSLGVSLFIFIIDSISQIIDSDIVTKVTDWIAFSGRFNTFVEGVLDYANIAFFLSVTIVFLFLTVRVLEKKRWS